MGRATAAALAAEGCAVTMFARSQERLEQAKAEVPDALILAGDVRDNVALEAAVDMTVSARGRLDIIVNNAGGPPRGTFQEVPPEAWADAFELSLHSAVRLTRHALPYLKQSGRGRIVNITSWSVREPIVQLVLSNAVRPGVVGWAKSLSHELGPDGITVNTIAPGQIDRPGSASCGRPTPIPGGEAAGDGRDTRPPAGDGGRDRGGDRLPLLSGGLRFGHRDPRRRWSAAGNLVAAPSQRLHRKLPGPTRTLRL